MNKAQKEAWLGLSGCLVNVITFGYIYVKCFVLKELPEPINILPLLVVIFVLLGAPVVLFLKKQSPGEVEKDERDRSIEKRAVLAAFVSVFVLLFAATMIPRFITGLDGSVPVWGLAFINVGILVIAMAVYFVSVLVQYKGGKINE